MAQPDPTTAAVRDAFEVIRPDGAVIISLCLGAPTIYTADRGYTVTAVRGFDHPHGHGFIVVEREPPPALPAVSVPPITEET